MRRTPVLYFENRLFNLPPDGAPMPQITPTRKKPVNVASVPQLSPFRYPGGKTWLVPEVRSWLDGLPYRPSVLVEPFAGGGIVSLTSIAEQRVDRVLMCELDEEVASVWQTAVSDDAEWLCDRIISFEMTVENVQDILNQDCSETRDIAFRTIVKNRAQRGGIMAKGAGLLKAGENGKGISSRWYPETLGKRIRKIHGLRDGIDVVCADGISIMESFADDATACFFIDPPYTAGGKRAGRRLYNHFQLDHSALFDLCANLAGQFLMTYDDAEEVIDMATEREFTINRVPMKSTHHRQKFELLITP